MSKSFLPAGLIGLGALLVVVVPRPAPAQLRAAPKVDISHVKPLTEMGTEKYQGYPGGLYPDGQNQRPAAHEAAGRTLARSVQPLDAEGQPSPDGKIGMISVGMSNTYAVFAAFLKAARADPELNPRLVIANTAQHGNMTGMTAVNIQDPNDNGKGTEYWTAVDQRLRGMGLSPRQVQVVWIKQADARPDEGFPGYARKLQAELTKIVQLLPPRYPNVKLVYLSSRSFAGWAVHNLNPEPYAYESGFAVKWLIERQLSGDPALNFDPAKGPVQAPWLSWGAYFWANGTHKRADGFFFVREDFGLDGTHPTIQGAEKIGQEMVRFFKTDTTARPWFLRPGSAAAQDRALLRGGYSRSGVLSP